MGVYRGESHPFGQGFRGVDSCAQLLGRFWRQITPLCGLRFRGLICTQEHPKVGIMSHPHGTPGHGPRDRYAPNGGGYPSDTEVSSAPNGGGYPEPLAALPAIDLHLMVAVTRVVTEVRSAPNSGGNPKP